MPVVAFLLLLQTWDKLPTFSLWKLCSMCQTVFFLLALFAVVIEANQYYYAPLGPWGLESTVINAKVLRQDSSGLKEVKTTSRKDDKKRDEVKEVKSDPQDDFEKAEEAIFHAVETVEHALEKAIDDEVETLYPHHEKVSDE